MPTTHVHWEPPRIRGAAPFVQRRGSLLLEAILSIAVFSLFLTGIGLTLFLGEHSTISGADRVRATFLAEQALEGIRQIRDEDFDALSAGTYGIVVENGRWSLQAQPVTSSGFVSELRLIEHSSEWFEARSAVTWNFGKTRSGSVVFSTFLTDWHQVVESGDWSTLRYIQTFTGGIVPQFNSILVYGDFAFVTGDTSEGGDGLYVFDISDPSSPERVASSFDLSSGAYDMTVQGTHLLLATDSPTAEVKAYDITDPSALSSDDVRGSYDLPGNGLARTIDSFNGAVFVGGNHNVSGDEFFSLFVTETGALIFADSLNVDANITDISLQDGYAYIATSDNGAEVQVIDVFDQTDLSYLPGKGTDLTNEQDGTITHTFGTSAIIGRKDGSTISELELYSIDASPLPSAPPGPWTLEVGGDVLGFDVDPTGTYGFLSGSFAAGELRTISISLLRSGANPYLAAFDASSAVKDLTYDWVRDRLFAVTATNLYIFAPGS